MTTSNRKKAAIFEAGLSSTSYQQIDDTSARVKGQNHYMSALLKPMPKEKSYSWFLNTQSCLYTITPLNYQHAFRLERAM